MRIPRMASLFLFAALLPPAAAAGDFVSKSYEFKPNRPLEVGHELAAGIRFDSIEFKVPAGKASGDGPRPLLDRPRAVVTISNHGNEPARVGIAIAIVDADGRLVAAASGGTKMFPLRAGRQMAYTIGFDDVVDRIGEGTAFRITVETRP